jgi:undecaprenyl-diphosphatase
MMLKFVAFWQCYLRPYLAFLIATIGRIRLAICLLTLLIVVSLSADVLTKNNFGFDQSFLLWLHQFANPYLDLIMLKITQLGNPSFVITVSIITFCLLWLRNHHREAIIFLLACLGASILHMGMKLIFAKPRPQLWMQLITPKTFSFPSGHALGSLVLYGFIEYLLSQYYPKFAQLIYIFTVTLIFLIGLSRLYLGVHWPTDIIAGYGIGFLWLTLCLTWLTFNPKENNNQEQ